MRWLFSGVLFAIGGVLLYQLAAGIFIATPPALSPGDQWGSALSPLWRLTPAAAAVLFGGVGAVVFGVGIQFWTRKFRPDSRDPWRWNSLLQSAFSLNVLLVASLILGLSVAVRGPAALDTIGHLFLLTLLFVAVGSILAFVLLRRKKRLALYLTTLMIHLIEVGALGAVFVKGYWV